MKILPVAAEMFHVDGRTDGQADMTKLVVAFRNVEKAPQNRISYKGMTCKTTYKSTQ